jgi:hypothetical protein
MDEPGIDPAAFAFTYPVWVCVCKDNHGSVIGSGTLEGGRVFLAVFTDGDLAERFLTERGERDAADIIDIPNSANFAGALKDLQLAGYSHIVFDCTGKLGDAGRVFDIPALLQAIEGNPS